MGCPQIPLPLLFIFLVAIFLEKSVGVVSIFEYSDNKQASNSTLENIHEYLKKINKPAVKTIEAPNGDIIACVDKWKQPAFDHPLLKDHKLPSVSPEPPNILKRQNKNSSTTSYALPLIVTGCPKGTVPIKRITVDDVLRAKSLQDFGRKKRSSHFDALNKTTISPNDVESLVHEYAIVVSQPGSEIYGAGASINLWNPYVAIEEEMSISQLWLVNGDSRAPSLNTIEIGLMVYPKLFEDAETHLFVFWTANNYASGCYNLDCPGFVQMDETIVVGTKLFPLSITDGPQAEAVIFIYKDKDTGHWWFAYGPNAQYKVGYWPAHIFTSLRDNAREVHWGGEITNDRIGGSHTITQMGSGRFANEGYRRASYFRDIFTMDSNNVIDPPREGVSMIADNANCYNLIRWSDDDSHEFSFYYGGPGFNTRCP